MAKAEMYPLINITGLKPSVKGLTLKTYRKFFE
jgi:hypothetical protein